MRPIAPAFDDPALNWYVKAALAAARNLLADPSASQFAQDRLRFAAAQTQVVGKSCRELPQLVIEKWRARFERMMHRRAVYFGQVLTDKPGTPVITEKFRQQISR